MSDDFSLFCLLYLKFNMEKTMNNIRNKSSDNYIALRKNTSYSSKLSSLPTNPKPLGRINSPKDVSLLLSKFVRPQINLPNSQQPHKPSGSNTVPPRVNHKLMGGAWSSGEYSGGYSGYGGYSGGYSGYGGYGGGYGSSSGLNQPRPGGGVSSSHNLRSVRPDKGEGEGNAVCAIAVASGVSYARAWNAAVENGYSVEGGMGNSQIEATLKDLGVKYTRHYGGSYSGWKDLPDLAIVTVNLSGDLHSVVFERRSDGREYIYDSHKNAPCGTRGYTLDTDDSYFAIHRHGSHSNGPRPSTHNLRVVRPDPGDRNPCAICAIAVASGVSYARAWNAANRNGYTPEDGMANSHIEATLEDLGVDFTRYLGGTYSGWDDLPYLAIVTVKINDFHAVVFERRSDGKEYIYDSHKHSPCGIQGYKLVTDDSYFFIRR
jgi:hypothetical protein